VTEKPDFHGLESPERGFSNPFCGASERESTGNSSDRCRVPAFHAA
jgi:hypothetical protein